MANNALTHVLVFCLGTLAKMHTTRMTLAPFKIAPCFSNDTSYDLFTQKQTTVLYAFIITDRA